MQKRATILLTGIISALCFGNANAQSTGSVHGTVSTPNGEPAGAVQVVVKGTSRRMVTTKDGTYLLKDVKAGRCVIVASRIGLIPQEKEIDIVAGETARVDFILAESPYQMGGVQVSALKSANEKPVAIGKVAIPPMDLPQSVMVVDRDILEQQQVQQLGEALKNVNGVYVMGNTGGTQQEIAGRGFAFGSSNTFKNGVRFNNSVMPEMSSIERLEVMKGSNAILFGNVAAGGVINLVTKKPQFTHGGEASIRVGSYSFYKPSLDVYGPFLSSERVAYRMNATYEKAKSFRDSVGSERVYLNPSFTILASEETDVLLEGDYVKDNRTNDYGTGAVDYTIANVPRNQFLGAPWSYFHAEQTSGTATVTHRFSEELQLRGVGGYQSYATDLFGTTRPNASSQFVKPDGTWIRGVQRTEVDEKYYIGQVDLTAKLATGFLNHTILFGADVDRYLTRTVAYDGVARYDTINIYDLSARKQRSDIPAVSPRTRTTAPLNRAGMYVQDLIEVTEGIKVLAGARWSYQETNSEVYTFANDTTTHTAYYDDAITPRFGVVYQPIPTMALFASYSNSFTLNTGVDVDGNALPPSFINQYEAGVKNDLFDGMLSANLTVYQIVNSNLAQTSLANGNTNANIKELAGEVTSKGVEVDIMSKPYHGFSVVAGYSYNQTTYTKSNTYIVGSELRYNPHHTANASLNYLFETDTWMNGLSLGVSALYFGERVAGRSTRLTVRDDSFKLMPVDPYTQIDVSAGYQFDQFGLRLKVSNLFDALSYHVHDDNSVNPIAPRMFSLTANFGL